MVSFTVLTSPKVNILNKVFEYPWDDSLQFGSQFLFPGGLGHTWSTSKVAFKQLLLEITTRVQCHTSKRCRRSRLFPLKGTGNVSSSFLLLVVWLSTLNPGSGEKGLSSCTAGMSLVKVERHLNGWVPRGAPLKLL